MGPLAGIEACLGWACVAAGAKAAEARPARAMSRANRRMADFIFGNLSGFEIEGKKLPSGRNLSGLYDRKQFFHIDNELVRGRITKVIAARHIAVFGNHLHALAPPSSEPRAAW